MEDFLDRIEDFLEAGSQKNTFGYANLLNVFVFDDDKQLILISNHDEPSVAIFDGEISEIPDDFIAYVIETLQPTEIEIKKC